MNWLVDGVKRKLVEILDNKVLTTEGREAMLLQYRKENDWQKDIVNQAFAELKMERNR